MMKQLTHLFRCTLRQQARRTLAATLALMLSPLLLIGCQGMPEIPGIPGIPGIPSSEAVGSSVSAASSIATAGREFAYRKALASKVGDEAADEIMGLAKLDLHDEARLLQVVALTKQLISDSSRLFHNGVAEVGEVFQEKAKSEQRYVEAFEQLQSLRQPSDVLATESFGSEADSDTRDAAIEAIFEELEAAQAAGYQFSPKLQRQLRGAYTQFLMGLVYQVEAYEVAGVVQQRANTKGLASSVMAGDSMSISDTVGFATGVVDWATNSIEIIDLFFKLEQASSVTGIRGAEEMLAGDSVTTSATAQDRHLALSYKERALMQKERAQMRQFAEAQGIRTAWLDCGSQPELNDRADLKAVQQLLNSWGYSVGSVDGSIGPRSRQKISEFQQAEGMLADGRPTQPLLQALRGELRNSVAAQQGMGAAVQSAFGSLFGAGKNDHAAAKLEGEGGCMKRWCLKGECQ